MSLAALPLALAIDAATGEPAALWRRTGHPVTWFGAAIDAADRRLNTGAARRARGVAALALLLAVFALPALALGALLDTLPWLVGLLLEAALASALIAHRSLHDHVAAVAQTPTLAEARRAVSQIVGRDPQTLDETGVARATIETLAENLSDGVVAPAFWFAIGGLPGIVAYKVVNTADSMIGHRTPRHAEFGWAAARLDDLMNIVPARLTALLTLLLAPRARASWRAVADEARGHVSPNAGWPEAAFAAGLGVSLGGPRRYGTREVDGVWLCPEGRAPGREDIDRALRLSTRIGLVHAALYAALALL